MISQFKINKMKFHKEGNFSDSKKKQDLKYSNEKPRKTIKKYSGQILNDLLIKKFLN